MAVKNLIEDYVLPLCSKITSAKQAQTVHINKLINLVNSKVMVDFMSELFCTLQELFPKYVGSHSCKLMTFDQFASFARDYDIFPRFCSKPALYRIFHTLALMKEALQPSPLMTSTKKLLSQHSVSTMNPNSQTLTSRQMTESIDRNLFIEAITLCALYQD